MATEIDSLALKIESSSADAKAAIDRLVRAMKKLKQLDISGAVENIHNLTGALDGLGDSDAADTLSDVARGIKGIGGSATGLRKAGASANAFGKALGWIASVVGLDKLSDQFKEAMRSAAEWDGIANRFGMGFGDQAQEVVNWADTLNQTLHINKQEFMRYAGTFASLANGFGVANEKVAPLSVGLTELAYDLYAYSNDLYSFEEAMRAVRSAITGELEPIRNAGLALSEAMLKETAAAHGIEQSVESMTESQKALLRYTAMIEQAADIGMIGTYVTELNTAEGSLRVLKQQVIGLGQALGSLFLPILAKVIPYVQAFVVVLTNAVKAVMGFFNIDFQAANWGKYSSGVGGVAADADAAADGLNGAAKAAKKLKDYTMGFDELNVINPNTGSSGGSGVSVGGGFDLPIDIESLWDDALLASVQNQVSQLVPKMQELLKIVLLVGGAFAAWKIGTSLYTGVTGLMQALSMIGKAGPLPQAATMFTPLITGINTVISTLTASFAPVLAIVLGVAAAIYTLCEHWDWFKTSIQQTFEELGIMERLQSAWESLMGIGAQFPSRGVVVSTVGTVIIAFFDAIGMIIDTLLIGAFTGLLNTATYIFQGLSAIIVNVASIFDGAIRFIVALFTFDFYGVLFYAAQIGQGIIDVFGNFIATVITAVLGFVEGVISFFTNLWDVLVGHSIVPDMIEAIIDWFLSMPGVIMNAIIAWVGDVILWFTDLKDGAVEIFEEIWDGIKGIINSILGGIEKMANGVVDGVNTVIGALNGLSFTVPDWVPELGGEKFGFEIGYLSQVVLPRLADGGVLSTGQMFVAREAGPELVGSVGSRTAVLNNDQIVEAVSEGVYRAVIAAMERQQPGEQAVNVYLDGKQITSAVERRQKERGRTLMGTQVYSY